MKHKDHLETQPSKPGPVEERLKIDGDWESAVSKALKKKRPAKKKPSKQEKPA